MLSDFGSVLCLVFWLISITDGRADGDQDFRDPAPDFRRHSLGQPVVLHGRTKREISTTRDMSNAHHPELTMSFPIDGDDDYIFDLRLNHDLIPDNHILSYQDNGRNVLSKPKKQELDFCHYRGSVRDKPGSWVAVSTCHGVQGIVFDGERMRYIEPAQDGGLNSQHYIYDHSDLIDPNLRKYVRNEVRKNTESRLSKRRISRSKRSAGSNIHEPYNANKESHYVQLALVVDSGMYKAHNYNKEAVHHQMLIIANYINALYSPLNIFVALVGVEVWETDQITVDRNASKTLANFVPYQDGILKKNIPHNNAQLIVQQHFIGTTVGLGYVNSMCTTQSCAVANNHTKNIELLAMTMAHEMGHNFGMNHDEHCECKEKWCIMNAYATFTTHWSSCSLRTLQLRFSKERDYSNECLRNKPKSLFESPTCGNGFVEPGEQCDCGTMAIAGAYNPCHACCDPSTCMLRANATCGAGMCCDLQTCQLKSSGTVCRAAQECDLPEYCDGSSEYCPDDVYMMDTTRCEAQGMVCMTKKCVYQNPYLKPKTVTCPSDCSGRGVCNSEGHCHCDAGYGSPNCAVPGPGGSYDSGPATDTTSRDLPNVSNNNLPDNNNKKLPKNRNNNLPNIRNNDLPTNRNNKTPKTTSHNWNNDIPKDRNNKNLDNRNKIIPDNRYNNIPNNRNNNTPYNRNNNLPDNRNDNIPNNRNNNIIPKNRENNIIPNIWNNNPPYTQNNLPDNRNNDVTNKWNNNIPSNRDNIPGNRYKKIPDNRNNIIPNNENKNNVPYDRNNNIPNNRNNDKPNNRNNIINNPPHNRNKGQSDNRNNYIPDKRNKIIPENRIPNNWNNDLPDNRNNIIPNKRNNNPPHNRNNDLPKNRNNDMPEYRNNNVPNHRTNIIPNNRHNNPTHNRNNDLPKIRNNNIPDNRNNNVPNHRNNIIPNNRHNNPPHNRNNDLPDNRNNNVPNNWYNNNIHNNRNNKPPHNRNNDLPDNRHNNIPNKIPDNRNNNLPDNKSQIQPVARSRNFMIAMYAIFLGITPGLIITILLFISRHNILKRYKDYYQRRLSVKSTHQPRDPPTDGSTGGACNSLLYANLENSNSHQSSSKAISLPINKRKFAPPKPDIYIINDNTNLNIERNLKAGPSIVKTHKISNEKTNAADLSDQNRFRKPSSQTKPIVNDSSDGSQFKKSLSLVKLKPVADKSFYENVTSDVKTQIKPSSKFSNTNPNTAKLNNEKERMTVKQPIKSKPDGKNLSHENAALKPPVKNKPKVNDLSKDKPSLSSLSNKFESTAKPSIKLKPNVINLSKENTNLSKLSHNKVKPPMKPKPNVNELSRENGPKPGTVKGLVSTMNEMMTNGQHDTLNSNIRRNVQQK